MVWDYFSDVVAEGDIFECFGVGESVSHPECVGDGGVVVGGGVDGVGLRCFGFCGEGDAILSSCEGMGGESVRNGNAVRGGLCDV